MKDIIKSIVYGVFIGMFILLIFINYKQNNMIKQQVRLIDVMEETIKLQDTSKKLMKEYIKVLEEK